MTTISNPVLALQAASEIARSLPDSIWHANTGAVLFRIANGRAEYVANDYVASGNDLVFRYANTDGYITIQQVFPARP